MYVYTSRTKSSKSFGNFSHAYEAQSANECQTNHLSHF